MYIYINIYYIPYLMKYHIKYTSLYNKIFKNNNPRIKSKSHYQPEAILLGNLIFVFFA